jgi:hypothetical protein
MKQVTAKFGKMRKAVEWVVYPQGQGDADRLQLQSDHRCIIIDAEKRVGLLSPHVANYPTFAHCGLVGREIIKDVPQEIIDAAKQARPQRGDQIGGGVFVG